jgi:hypothetical protein
MPRRFSILSQKTALPSFAVVIRNHSLRQTIAPNTSQTAQEASETNLLPFTKEDVILAYSNKKIAS